MEDKDVCNTCLNFEIQEIIKKCNKCIVKEPVNIEKMVKTILNIYFKLSDGKNDL